ncbi:hypothetical protein AQS8620_02980 [Aquimixticola soesokkakensis]|uniref:Retroviral aspartyl protease n=1 Tax=Aquimixticola soesokkakensis TaxID=1519096 RepID=A0A1Y5TI71_9RHOB|nr:TIGR02281 family clan AA aspartic protease [Aquimixticola soesokkakensis]SLN64874.1 hypothetical protein AQS8620_02980 [Aquimixticola soesokkakensis]
MDQFDSAQLLYFALLLGALVTYVIVANRRELGRLARHGVMWCLLFIGLLAAYGMWNDVSSTLVPRQSVVSAGVIDIPRGADGHYGLVADVNGTPINFMIDTGATTVVLAREDAQRAGIDLDQLAFTGVASTANGRVQTAPVHIDLALEGVIDDRFRAYVTNGEMPGSLMGMDYLNRYSKIEISDGVLRLTR